MTFKWSRFTRIHMFLELNVGRVVWVDAEQVWSDDSAIYFFVWIAFLLYTAFCGQIKSLCFKTKRLIPYDFMGNGAIVDLTS